MGGSQARRQRAGPAAPGLGAGRAGGACPRTDRPLVADRGVASQRGGPDGPRRGAPSGPLPAALVPKRVLRGAFTPLPSQGPSGAPGLPPRGPRPGRHAGKQGTQGLGLGGSGPQRVLEGEGLYGEGGGALVLRVAHRLHGAVLRDAQTAWKRTETVSRKTDKELEKGESVSVLQGLEAEALPAFIY